MSQRPNSRRESSTWGGSSVPPYPPYPTYSYQPGSTPEQQQRLDSEQSVTRGPAYLESRLPLRPEAQPSYPIAASGQSVYDSSPYRWRDSRPPDTLMQTVPRALQTPYADSLAPILNPEGVGRRPGVSAQEQEIPYFSSHPSPEVTTSTYNVASTQISSQRHRVSGTGIPLGFEQLLHPQGLTQTSVLRGTTPVTRFNLHIRQQPIAARACGAGDKDRRPIDPPPILQMLLVDFDPNSRDDRNLLESRTFTVGCFLYSIKQIPNDPNPLSSPSHHSGEREQLVPSSCIIEAPSNARMAAAGDARPNPQGRAFQLLSGSCYVSPFYVEKDPDPTTAPTYPLSRPSMSPLPASFFVFTDLSVRKAGVYRLNFKLTDWGVVEETGQPQPILAEAWSEPFTVYSSKDFPGMRESSNLTEQLRQLGIKDLRTRGKDKGKNDHMEE